MEELEELEEMEDIKMFQDPDPIIASYEVYIKPDIGTDRQMYVLQFPDRNARHPYSVETKSAPSKLRIKPHAGMVELDVAMDATENYDRGKGFKWGNSIKKSNLAKNGGSHGLPGGFGIGGSLANPRGRPRIVEDEEVTRARIVGSEAEFIAATKTEQVLVKQTLGGQAIPIEETTPLYMIGAFRKNQLHLTPVDQIVQMRPQFHHIDAFTEQERIARRDPSVSARAVQAQAVHMTIKSSTDGEEDATETMGARISTAQGEAWKTHKYIDENAGDAWVQFEKDLMVGGLLYDGETIDAKLESLPRLASALNDSEYLDTISTPSNPAKLSRSKTKAAEVKDHKCKGKEVAANVVQEDDSDSESDSDEKPRANSRA